jgi:hypothetical protein
MLFDDLTGAEVEAFRRELAKDMAEAVGVVATVDDPAEVELCGFELATSLALAPPQIVAEALGMIATEEHGERLLHAMAVAASPPVSQLAAAAVETPKRTAFRPDRAHLLDWGDAQSVIVAGTRRDTSGIQILVLQLEQSETRGAVKDGFASSIVGTEDLDQTLQSAAAEGVEPREIAVAEAVELVAAGARRCVENAAGPTDDATLAVNLLLRASEVEDAEELLAALPALPAFVGVGADADPDNAEAQIEELTTALEEWCDESDDLPEGATELILDAGFAMASFRAGYRGGVHTPWTEHDLVEFLLDYVPRKVDVAEEDVERFPLAVSHVFHFLSESGVVPARAALAFAATTLEMTREFVEAASDPANFGPAKALAGAMARDGVDLGDRAAIDTWIGEWNSLPIEERRRLPMALPEPPPDVVHAGPGTPAKRTAARKAARKARRRNRRGKR